MPSKPIADKSQCRYCKLRAPAVAMKLVKGLPQGECKPCNRNRQLRARLLANFHLGLYKSLPDLVAANVKTLATLAPGTYSLARNGLNTQVGYIIVQIDSICVNIYNDCDLFRYDLFGIASYLGNLNAFIDTKAAIPQGFNGAPVIAPEALQGLSRIDVQERLIWYNSALVAKAVKLIRDEVRQAKSANLAKARATSINTDA